jgi:hypothetical protein
MRRNYIGFAVLACVALPALALDNRLAENVRHCASEMDPTKRLACFDAMAASLPKVEADQFGLTADIARKRDPVAEHKNAEAILPGEIVALGQTRDGKLVFTLDNKQVWVQAEIKTQVQFEVGDAVHIEHGAMGSLWLAADKGRKTRVKRVS